MIPDGAVLYNSRQNEYEIFNLDRCVTDRYYACPNGRVWSEAKQDYLIPNIEKRNGRPKLKLRVNGKEKSVKVHTIIGYCLVDNQRYLSILHHVDGSRTNNRPENLLYVTAKEHAELHRLMRTDYNRYLERVSEIEELNKWKC